MHLLVRIIAGFFRFWYDFIVGDSWEIATGVVVSLVACVVVLRQALVPEAALPLLLAAGLMAVLVGSVVAELRRKLAKG
jgi:hypothetical protein